MKKIWEKLKALRFNVLGKSIPIQRYVTKRINSQYQDGEIKLPQIISIETFNRCNNDCPFCPANCHNDIRKAEYMDENVFSMIISQLKNWGYVGEICLSGNNEPFLDKRIVKFAEIVSRELPFCKLSLWTNAMFLDLAKFVSIMDFLDEIQIDNYNDEYIYNKNVKNIKEFVEKNAKMFEKKEIVINLRKKNEVLSSRGGSAPNKNKVSKEYIHAGCFSPFKEMFVRPNGDLALCCSDVYGAVRFGNVKDKTLKEWWYGKEYEKFRTLLKNDREGISICRNCDYIRG